MAMSLTASSSSSSSMGCECTKPEKLEPERIAPCKCPRDDHGIVIHEVTCVLYKNETFFVEHGECTCCLCPLLECKCDRAGREAFDEWRNKRGMSELPAVLESTHPLMQKFQNTLKQFLERENAIAEEQILGLRDELRLGKQAYEKDLETIYRDDHDTNAQRAMIEEYEVTLVKSREERIAAEQRLKETNIRYHKAQEKLSLDTNAEREASQEVEALSSLVRQLEAWREETESELTVNQRVSDKMRVEKKAIADEKRELDVLIYSLSNEVWALESKLELFRKQFEIKNVEMEKINDKVTAYSTELDDLELDKRRLVCLWNSVLVNIGQRDKVYDSVRADHKQLQESYRTLLINLAITKKVVEDEMNRSKELAMNKEKLVYDTTSAKKLSEAEEAKKVLLDTQITEINESIQLIERDQDMIKMENQTMLNILTTTEKDFDHKTEQKLKLENEILQNLQDILLNDKAVESMANGIKKMRELGRKQELALVAMENSHAKIMLDIESSRALQARNAIAKEALQSTVRARESEIDELQAKFDSKVLDITRKQRELDIVVKKYAALKEIFDSKSPQERRIEELENQIKGLRERTESMQHEWLRLQGHVVKLTAQHHKVVADINLINKQIQICEQKTMRIQADIETVNTERGRVERALRELRGRLEVLERARRDAGERGDTLRMEYQSLTYEYAAKLKDADAEVFQLEESIETFEKDKINLTQSLDRIQREALIWQRKGILAVELKKNMSAAKSAVGEIGQMRTEIHRMEVRREQLRRTSEKLSEDLAALVTRRECAMDKSRAQAAVEKAHGAAGHTSQSVYHHKLRLARADLQRVTKELADAKAHMEHLKQEQTRLAGEVEHTGALNAQLEEQVAALLRQGRAAERQKQWLLERVVRTQRLGSELATVVKRQSVRVKKPKPVVIEEYNQALALNSTIKGIVHNLNKEYPHLEEKFESILNTLNIFEPGMEWSEFVGRGGPCEELEMVEEKTCPCYDVDETPSVCK